MGTHITKVKSLSMDSWSTDQVDNMKRIGNVRSNLEYKPKNTRPQIPVDADEADSAMERFIKQKYAPRLQQRTNTGSSNSDDNQPPLPPKTRFGFRSASSIFPLSSKHRRSVESPQRSPSPPRNKESRIFGATVGSDSLDRLDSKLEKLRDMGFRDDRRNTAVLKGLGGNLEKSIETLVRLGEGSGMKTDSPSSGVQTPLSLAGLGLSMNRASPQSSNNPFDKLDEVSPAIPQSSQSTGGQMAPQNTNNPFGLMPSQSQYSLNQAFQNMSVSSQPLFPNHTGGFLAQQPHQPMYQQAMTPPVPSIPQQHYPPIYENPAQQPQNYNPFMQQQPPPINTNFQSNPYTHSMSAPLQANQNSMVQSPQQYQSQSAFHSSQLRNPFLQNTTPQSNYQPQQQYQRYQQQTYPLIQQNTGKADKRSILDLYNQPQMPPTPQTPQNYQISSQNYQVPSPTQLGVSSPLSQPLSTSGNRNPFMPNGQVTTGDVGIGNMQQFSPNGARHVVFMIATSMWLRDMELGCS
ncbi:hypothetical protein B7494_g3364 [Chlorociboria aeruginascens]|nr:hypothetical protein B7494_g3364 [Chlorociboria aeruginascens]